MDKIEKEQELLAGFLLLLYVIGLSLIWILYSELSPSTNFSVLPTIWDILRELFSDFTVQVSMYILLIYFIAGVLTIVLTIGVLNWINRVPINIYLDYLKFITAYTFSFAIFILTISSRYPKERLKSS